MAVKVVEEGGQTQQQGGMMDPLYEIIAFFQNNWELIIAAIIIGALAIGFYFLYKRISDEREQRDNKVYLHFVNVEDSCIENTKKEWINKYWKPSSLWLLLIPIFGWIAIPFVKKESSAKIRNIDGDFVGWYRGHTYLDDGTVAIRYYNSKSFFFFEDTKILLIPTKIDYTEKDDDGNKIKKFLKVNPVHFKDYEIRVSMEGVRKRGMYFYFPVLVTNEGNPIHLSETIIEKLRSNTGYEVIEGLTADYSRQIQKAVNISADVRRHQERAEPEQDVRED